MKCFLVAAFLAAPLAWHTTAWSTPETKPAVSHQMWVEHSLHAMSTIKVGMTRQQLMKVFTWPGGAWSYSRTRQTFAYQDCPNFLVDVEFKSVGALQKGWLESPHDRIVKISKPYINEAYSN